jgi:hypothetical protein
MDGFDDSHVVTVLVVRNCIVAGFLGTKKLYCGGTSRYPETVSWRYFYVPRNCIVTVLLGTQKLYLGGTSRYSVSPVVQTIFTLLYYRSHR